MFTILRSLAACGLITAIVGAQTLLSGATSPNPAPLGASISLRLEATATAGLASGCGFLSIRQGSPAGPVVYSPFICPAIFIIVSPGGPYTAGWSGLDSVGNPVPAGLYFFEVGYSDGAGVAQPNAFFPVRIDDPAAPPQPVLTVTGTGAAGTTLNLDINSPADAGSPYIFAASFTTNTGFTVPPGVFVVLDMDVLFGLAFPTPTPGLFSNLSGTLDANGQTFSPGTVSIPNVPGLLGYPVAFQAVLVTVAGLGTTNPVTLSLQ
jgi:hypothetical protein